MENLVPDVLRFVLLKCCEPNDALSCLLASKFFHVFDSEELKLIRYSTKGFDFCIKEDYLPGFKLLYFRQVKTLDEVAKWEFHEKKFEYSIKNNSLEIVKWLHLKSKSRGYLDYLRTDIILNRNIMLIGPDLLKFLISVLDIEVPSSLFKDYLMIKYVFWDRKEFEIVTTTPYDLEIISILLERVNPENIDRYLVSSTINCLCAKGTLDTLKLFNEFCISNNIDTGFFDYNHTIVKAIRNPFSEDIYKWILDMGRIDLVNINYESLNPDKPFIHPNYIIERFHWIKFDRGIDLHLTNIPSIEFLFSLPLEHLKMFLQAFNPTIRKNQLFEIICNDPYKLEYILENYSQPVVGFGTLNWRLSEAVNTANYRVARYYFQLLKKKDPNVDLASLASLSRDQSERRKIEKLVKMIDS